MDDEIGRCPQTTPPFQLNPPDYLVIGHLTRDLLPTTRSTPGGTALYAAITAQRLGYQAAILTTAAELPQAAVPSLWIKCLPAETTSTFENRYLDDTRQQWIHAVAPALGLEALPSSWYATPMVHLGPVLHECDLTMIKAFPNALIGVTPQGWMRRWNLPLPAPITRAPWHPSPSLLARINVLTLSIDDVEGDEHIVAHYAQFCRCVALTRGAAGVTLYVEGTPHHVPAYPANEVDPTGAGDVFAAAMLAHLYTTGDVFTAARFATKVAAAAIGGYGTSTIPVTTR